MFIKSQRTSAVRDRGQCFPECGASDGNFEYAVIIALVRRASPWMPPKYSQIERRRRSSKPKQFLLEQ